MCINHTGGGLAGSIRCFGIFEVAGLQGKLTL